MTAAGMDPNGAVEPLADAEARLLTILRRDLLKGVGAGAALGAMGGSTAALAASPAGLKAWSDYVDLLKPADALVARTLYPNDEQTRAELYRQLVMNIAQGYIWYFQSTPEHPDWMPFENSIFLLQPNPDAVYHLAPISGSGTYRVVGKRGGNPIMGFAVGRTMFGTSDPGPGFNNYDVDGLTIGRDGSFEVVFSTERPKGWAGDWRYLHPEAGCLMIRQFANDWGGEESARFAIERLDGPILKPRLTTAQIADRLDRLLGYFVRNFSGITIGFQNATLKRLGWNTMEISSFEDLGNSPEWPQKYWRCMFDCQPGEALVIETEIPRCKYWNVQLNDTLWNQIEFGYRQSSLNGHQARLDADGKFRAVLAHEDPGVQNWLDPQGFARGMLIGRWHRADSYPLPTLKRVPLDEVHKHLPADTPRFSPAERDKQIRARNLGLQLRRRW